MREVFTFYYNILSYLRKLTLLLYPVTTNKYNDAIVAIFLQLPKYLDYLFNIRDF